MTVRSMKQMVAVAAVVAAMGTQADAATLLLDFGNGANSLANNPSFKTDSPAYAAGALSVDTTPSPVWNSPLTVGDRTTDNLQYIDGTTATGVTYDLAAAVGTSSVVPTSITFGATSGATQPANTLADGTINSGIYTDGKVAAGAIFVSSSGGSSTYTTVGLRVAGLALGTYDVFVVSRNTNTSLTTPQNLTLAATDNTLAYALPAATTMSNTAVAGGGSPTPTTSFIAGDNYLKLSVTLTADNPYLTLTSTGGIASEARGWLNSVEIVSTAVPEPTSLGLIASLGAGSLLRRRR